MQYVAVFVTQYNSSLSSFVPNFWILSQVVAEKSLTEKNVHMYFIGQKEKLKIWKKTAKWGLASQFSFTLYTLPTWRCSQNLKTLAPIGAEKSVTEISLKRKKNEQIKGLICNMWQLFRYIQYKSSLSSFVHNFKILTQVVAEKTQVVAEKSLTEKNVHMYYIRVTEGKNEKLKKDGKMRISILIFIYTIHFVYLKVYTQFENSGFNRSWAICDRNFH